MLEGWRDSPTGDCPECLALPRTHRAENGLSDFDPPAESHRAAVVPRMGRFPVVVRESTIALLPRDHDPQVYRWNQPRARGSMREPARGRGS